jgi:hypothetical protein
MSFPEGGSKSPKEYVAYFVAYEYLTAVVAVSQELNEPPPFVLTICEYCIARDIFVSFPAVLNRLSPF